MDREKIIDYSIRGFGYSAVIILVIFPIILGIYSIPFLKENSVADILTQHWKPESGQFGLGRFILSTLIMGLISTGISFLTGLSIALYLFHHRFHKRGTFLRKLIQTMGGIPTVVYGLGGIIILVPLIRKMTSSPTGLSLITVSLVLALLILPTVVLYIDDSFQAITDRELLAPFSLGATDDQLVTQVLIPRALPGIITAGILGFSRSISDTMVALMLSGNALLFPDSLFQSARNLTSHIALIMPGEFDSIEFKAVFFSALILIGFVFVFNVIIHKLDKNHG